MKKIAKNDSKETTASLNLSLYRSSLDQPDIKNVPSSNNITNNNTSNNSNNNVSNNSNNNVSNNFSNNNSNNNVSNKSSGSQRQQRWLSLRQFFHNFHQQRFINRARKPNKQNTDYSRNSKAKKAKDKQTLGGSAYQNSILTTPPVLSDFQKHLARENLKECPICTLIQSKDNYPPMSATLCPHQSCTDCMKQYLRIEITESRVNIACPECPTPIHPNDIRSILIDNPNLFSKYEEFMLRRVLTSDPDARWCPAPNCNFVVIASGCASCPKIQCLRPGCGTTFCYHCKQHWHPNQTCDAAKAERSSSSSNFKPFSLGNESNAFNDMKSCPRCQAYIIKMADGSCNHMICAICGAEFCWLCMKEISDLHYLSPSGCTFWGKKPWSQKKKVLWQLGTLVGAPVGIVLIAGIAVPTIIIGVPVWVGRRIFTKCSYMTAHKRNLSIAGGIISSTLVSPLLAAIAVGIGVPILLAYVYGVVPISLCRSGGCGVHNGVGNGGDGDVVVEMEEEKSQSGVADASVKATTADTRSVVEGSTHGGVANPSIGPSIGEMSLAMTNSLSASGSHLERVGVIREDGGDRDSASHRAMAGSCVVESLSGSLLGGATGFQNRLEVQAEMAAPPNHPRTTTATTSDKRSSFSSDSNNLSIDNKSVSFGDNVSVVVIDNNNTHGNVNNHGNNNNNNNNSNSNHNSNNNNILSNHINTHTYIHNYNHNNNNNNNNSHININNNNNNNNNNKNYNNNNSGGTFNHHIHNNNNNSNNNNNNNNYNNLHHHNSNNNNNHNNNPHNNNPHNNNPNNNPNNNIVGNSLSSTSNTHLSRSITTIDHSNLPSIHSEYTNSAYNTNQQLNNTADHNNNKNSSNNNIKSFSNNNTNIFNNIHSKILNNNHPNINKMNTDSIPKIHSHNNNHPNNNHPNNNHPNNNHPNNNHPNNNHPNNNHPNNNHPSNTYTTTTNLTTTTTTSSSSMLRSSFQRYGSPPTARSVSFKTVDHSPTQPKDSLPHYKNHKSDQDKNAGCSSSSSGRVGSSGRDGSGSSISSGSKGKGKKQSMSVGDSIDEESSNDHQGSSFNCSSHSLASSKASYQQPKQPLVSCFPGGSDIVSMVMAVVADQTSPRLADQYRYVRQGDLRGGWLNQAASCCTVATTNHNQLHRCSSNMFASQCDVDCSSSGGGEGSCNVASCSSDKPQSNGSSGSGLNKLASFDVEAGENKTTTHKFKFLSSKPMPYFSRLLREEGYNRNKAATTTATTTTATTTTATTTTATTTTASITSTATTNSTTTATTTTTTTTTTSTYSTIQHKHNNNSSLSTISKSQDVK